jgi:hypothetical protein
MHGENEQNLPPVGFSACLADSTTSHGFGRSKNTAEKDSRLIFSALWRYH